MPALCAAKKKLATTERSAPFAFGDSDCQKERMARVLCGGAAGGYNARRARFATARRAGAPCFPGTHPSGPTLVLTRESIQSGFVQKMAREGGMADALSDAEIAASLASCLARAPKRGDLWVFAYGSLIWNPTIHVEERRIARVAGYHRRFCLWTNLGRGTPEFPGLILALDNGGACAGVALRVARRHAEAEFEILWRREMVSGAYVPRWLPVTTDKGERFPALAFTMNRRHARYSGKLPEAKVADHVARASGRLGSCTEYLDRTIQSLAEHGIRDEGLMRLKSLVARRCAEGPASA